MPTRTHEVVNDLGYEISSLDRSATTAPYDDIFMVMQKFHKALTFDNIDNMQTMKIIMNIS
jgi:hypothetical protein